MVINTVTDLQREYNRTLSGHWFDRDTLKCFSSRFRDKIYKGRYFISSEKASFQTVRLYTIRVFKIVKSGKEKGKVLIDTVGEFQGFGSYYQAVGHIENYLK